MLHLRAVPCIHVESPLAPEKLRRRPPSVAVCVALGKDDGFTGLLAFLRCTQRFARFYAIDVGGFGWIAVKLDGRAYVLNVLVCADYVGVEELVQDNVLARHEVVEVFSLLALHAVGKVWAVEVGRAER